MSKYIYGLYRYIKSSMLIIILINAIKENMAVGKKSYILVISEYFRYYYFRTTDIVFDIKFLGYQVVSLPLCLNKYYWNLLALIPAWVTNFAYKHHLNILLFKHTNFTWDGVAASLLGIASLA